NTGPEKIVVPNVIGMKAEEAEAEMRKWFPNVEVKPATEEGPNAIPGTIILTAPVAGALVSVDQPIILYQATGQVMLPNLIGKSMESALMLLGQLGFDTGGVKIQYEPSTQPLNSVIKMSPDPGQEVAKDTPITLTVAAAMPVETTTPPATSEPTDGNT
ncbi:MAG: PASTA domain-containing protein, partial [Propionibacteriaceae bacterium]|nr:PASTA domain-containing protein [Propionibacteriaceae bacterium]